MSSALRPSRGATPVILCRSQHREAVLKSGYIYQLYAYLRSQERPDDPLSQTAEGVLLHPTIDGEVDQFVRTHGHDMRFVMVDLTLPTPDIIHRIRTLSQRSLPARRPPSESAMRGC